MKVATSPARIAALATVGVAAIATILLVAPSMSRDEAAITGLALGCVVLLVNARLRLVALS